MKLQEIADQALHLSTEERANLIQQLVASLDSPTVEDLRAEWLAEARHRSEELDKGTAHAIPGQDVIQRARAIAR
jgi:putative addiction module component (TIGR02574 family)